MNIFDGITISILLVCVMIGYQRGLLRSVFSLFSFLVSLYLSYCIYPYAGKLLRATALYDTLKLTIIRSMGLEELVAQTTTRAQTELIGKLPLAGPVINSLLANNNPEAYKALGVNSIADYIGGYFANMAINFIAMTLVFLAVRMLMRILAGMLDLLAKLPVIRGFNKLGGALIGLAQGTIAIWVVLTVFTLFLLQPKYDNLFKQMQAGLISHYFVETNPIMHLVMKIFP